VNVDLGVARLLIVLLAAGRARTTTPTPTPAPLATAAPAASAADDGEYHVGPGDALEIVVLDNVELSRTATVQTNGSLSLPLVGEVAVAPLTVAEIKAKLTTLLSDYVINPQVEVKVKEYHSQFVTVIGEVNNPGRKALRGRTRLLDVLLDAGGFTPRASGDVTVTRRDGTFAGGASTLRLRLGRTHMAAEDQANLETPLRQGDLVTASAKYYVTVEGEVARPSRYVIEPDLTVSAAISLAGGLTRYGSTKLTVRRTDPVAGTSTILKVDLKRIRKGEEQDLRLQAEDVVTVERSLF
jgi:polysaccharide export outer membrane protein